MHFELLQQKFAREYGGLMFYKKYAINELIAQPLLSTEELRSKLPILVIENGSFPVKDMLIKNGFRIDIVKDLESYNALSSYKIILCDINDVGLHLGFQDGSGLMREIKRRSPLLPVVAYSDYDQPLAKGNLHKIIDGFAEKDSSLEDWIELLDEYMKNLIDPVVQWKKAREQLLARNATIHLVANLENEFVKKVQTKRLEELKEAKDYRDLPDELKPIIQGVVSSVIYDVIKLIIRGS